MTDRLAAARNLGMKALRRLASAHKPIVRAARKRARRHEQVQFAREARAVEREIASVAAGSGPIIAGPWLAEVGYEALYWVPFLRWFQDAYRVAPERLVVVSRGGVGDWYAAIARNYVDIFEHLTPSELAARNKARMAAEEAGGRKQSAAGALDAEILGRVRSTASVRGAVLHPSAMFRLFRHVWHGSLPMDFLWTHTDFELLPRPARPAECRLPADYIAVKFYNGTALPDTPEQREALRSLVRQAAAIAPIVSLDTGLTVDEHEDYLFSGISGVVSARDWMEPRTNLGVQSAIVANSRMFLGTCGGLAWLAPFYGVSTVGVFADDRQLAPHLLVARQAGRRVGAADFSLIDLRAYTRIGALQPR